MTNEEKKAIENVKSFVYSILNGISAYDCKILLNLIEKQSKEIEELKMKLEVEKIDNKYNQEEAWEEMIPRYKIKAKIEELKKYSKEHGYINMRSEINVLQSLLEEE